MTVTAGTTKTTQNCNGSLTDFSFGFAIYKQENLEVIIRDIEQTETLLVLGTDYTVSGDDFSDGGTVSTIKEIAEEFIPFAWSINHTITIRLNIALTQETDLIYGGTFASESIERCSDKLTRIVQQLDEQLQRAIKLQKSSGQENVEIGDLEAGKFVIVNTEGNGLTMGTVAGEPGQPPVSNLPYNKDTWDTIADVAPSKNTVRDELVNNRFTKGGTYATVMALSHGIFSALPISNVVYGASWASVVDTAASKKAIYDKIEAMGDGAGDVVGPATNTDDYVPQWNGANSKILKNGFAITAAGKAILDDADAVAQRTTLGLGSAALRTAEDTLTDGSNLPDGHAIKTYGDANWGGVVGPATHAASYVPQWNTTPNSKTLIAGFAITAAGKAILDDADAVAQRTTLGFTDAILNKGIPGTIGQTTPGNVYSNRLKMSGQAGFILRTVSGSGYKTINWTTGLKYKLSLTGNVSLSFTNPTDVCNVLIEVVQPAGGGCTVTFPDSVSWTPSINSAANSVTIVCLFWDGTNYYGGGISNA